MSYSFRFGGGIRQDSCLSPALFYTFVSLFIIRLRELDNGCHIKNVFVGCILYAHDIILLSPSVAGLQAMLNCCSSTSADLHLKFNCAKSCCVIFEPAYKSVISEWTNFLKYLGLYLNSGNDLFNDISLIKRRFYSACNCLNANSHSQNELIQLQLLESYCLPVLICKYVSYMYLISYMYYMYLICNSSCTAAVSLFTKNINQLNTCWNSVYRRIFGFHRWKYVRTFINGPGRLDFQHVRCLLLAKFYGSLLYTQNVRLSLLYEELMGVDVNFAKFSLMLNSSLLRPSRVPHPIIV